MPELLVCEQRGKLLRARQRAGGVLPLPLAADEEQADPPAQPVQVLAVQVGDVVHGIVEVGGGAALAPAVPGRRIIVAGKAQGQREQVGSLEREVRRVERAQAAPEGRDVGAAAAIFGDPRHHLVDDPGFVAAVAPGPLFELNAGVRPGGGVVGIDAIELQPPGVHQVSDGTNHAIIFKVGGISLLGWKDEYWPAPVAVADHGAVGADSTGPQPALVAIHWPAWPIRAVRCGSSASRQAV